MSDLANRGQSALLEHAMEVNHLAPAQRDALRAMLALHQLNDPNARLSASQRQTMAQQSAAGIESAIATINDPQTLMDQANALLTAGVVRDANTLEYWGENPATQAAMKPVIEAVIKLQDKAATLAKQQADTIANSITSPDDPKAKQWEQLANLATAAAYKRDTNQYFHALALPRTDPQRKEIAGKAIDSLAQYDNADSSVQAAVRLCIGKLHMMRGEYEQAQQIFNTIATGKEISPPPDASQQWQARYSSVACEVQSGSLASAQKSLDALIEWQSQNLPKDKTAQEGATAATSILQYRIYDAAVQASSDPATKKAFNDKAVAVLMDLVKKRPDLQSVIFQQLMSKLPEGADLKTLDPLLLQGYIAAADQERLKPDDQPVDQKVLQRGLDAANELIARKNVDPQLLDSAVLVRAFILNRIGQHVDASNAFLDYTQSPGHSIDNLNLALDNAMAIIAQLRANPVSIDAPDTVKLYERFLAIATQPPFSRNEFAFEYARRLQQNGKLAAAVEMYRKVPLTDKRFPMAQFYLMATLGQRLDEEKLPTPQRQQIVTEITSMVDDAAKRISEGINTAKAAKEKSQYRAMLAGTLLLAADVARREQNDPKHALSLLQNFEQITNGLSNEKELLAHALYTRVQAYMASGDTNSATQALVALLKQRTGNEGASIVYKLMQKLNDELDQARRNGDLARMRQLAANRAQLSGFLVDWARNNPDPNIQKYTYRYMVVDAATKHLAADLESDPAKQKAERQATLKLYQQLESPQSQEMYKATLDPKSPEAKEPDPAVSLGIGLLSYDLGDYAEAQKRLGQLLDDRKLGTPTIAVEENGQTTLKENDQYWEATLDLMRSNVALAAAHPDDAAAQAAKNQTISYLKELYVKYGRNVGGNKWSGDFEALRKQIAPDLNPDDFTLPTTAPTSRPT